MKYRFIIFSIVALSAGFCFSADYVGSSACRNCHAKKHADWSKTNHAKAARKLSADDKKNILCRKCHFTGEANAGSKRKGVGCEACHGAGQYYIQTPVMKDRELAKAVGLIAKPDLQMCKSCHSENSPMLKKTDLKKMLKKICSHAKTKIEKPADAKKKKKSQ